VLSERTFEVVSQVLAPFIRAVQKGFSKIERRDIKRRVNITFTVGNLLLVTIKASKLAHMIQCFHPKRYLRHNGRFDLVVRGKQTIASQHGRARVVRQTGDSGSISTKLGSFIREFVHWITLVGHDFKETRWCNSAQTQQGIKTGGKGRVGLKSMLVSLKGGCSRIDAQQDMERVNQDPKFLVHWCALE
jgi:hypothetical protein